MTTHHEKGHMDRVAKLPCVLCKHLGRGIVRPVQVHHLRHGQGMGQRAANWLTIALCQDCHQGPNGLHGDRSLLRIGKVDELDLLAMTIEAMSRTRDTDHAF